mgnify:FL=1
MILEDSSFLEQVRLFQGAEFVAGRHGAGLANLVFAAPSCRVLEVFQPTYVLASTYKIATCLGQSYGYLVEGRVQGTLAATDNQSDIVVDPERFAKLVTMMLPNARA